MKLRHVMPLLGVLTCLSVTSPGEAEVQHILGAWQFAQQQKGRLTLTFNQNGSYVVDFNGDGGADIQGIYELWGERLIFRDEAPQNVTDCRYPGVYYFAIQNDRLSFEMYSDDCRPRRGVLAEIFMRGFVRGL